MSAFGDLFIEPNGFLTVSDDIEYLQDRIAQILLCPGLGTFRPRSKRMLVAFERRMAVRAWWARQGINLPPHGHPWDWSQYPTGKHSMNAYDKLTKTCLVAVKRIAPMADRPDGMQVTRWVAAIPSLPQVGIGGPPESEHPENARWFTPVEAREMAESLGARGLTAWVEVMPMSYAQADAFAKKHHLAVPWEGQDANERLGRQPIPPKHWLVGIDRNLRPQGAYSHWLLNGNGMAGYSTTADPEEALWMTEHEANEAARLYDTAESAAWPCYAPPGGITPTHAAGFAADHNGLRYPKSALQVETWVVVIDRDGTANGRARHFYVSGSGMKSETHTTDNLHVATRVSKKRADRLVSRYIESLTKDAPVAGPVTMRAWAFDEAVTRPKLPENAIIFGGSVRDWVVYHTAPDGPYYFKNAEHGNPIWSPTLNDAGHLTRAEAEFVVNDFRRDSRHPLASAITVKDAETKDALLRNQPPKPSDVERFREVTKMMTADEAKTRAEMERPDVEDALTAWVHPQVRGLANYVLKLEAAAVQNRPTVTIGRTYVTRPNIEGHPKLFVPTDVVDWTSVTGEKRWPNGKIIRYVEQLEWAEFFRDYQTS